MMYKIAKKIVQQAFLRKGGTAKRAADFLLRKKIGGNEACSDAQVTDFFVKQKIGTSEACST